MNADKNTIYNVQCNVTQYTRDGVKGVRVTMVTMKANKITLETRKQELKPQKLNTGRYRQMNIKIRVHEKQRHRGNTTEREHNL